MALHRVRPEVPGQLADTSTVDYSVNPPVVSELHLEVIGWQGDDIVSTFPVYLVSPELGSALQQGGLTGFELADAEITINPERRSYVDERIESFKWLKVTGIPGEQNLGQDERTRLIVDDEALDVIQRFQLETGYVMDWPLNS